MKKFIQIILALLPVAAATTIKAQSKNITITGRVVSFEESLGLEGVSITIKGSSYNTGTHADGTFSLSVDATDKTLVFRLDGYQTTELKLNDKAVDYEVVLKTGKSDNASGASAAKKATIHFFAGSNKQDRKRPVSI